MTLADTSIWVSYLSKSPTPKAIWFDQLISRPGRLLTTEIVLQEVLQGARDEKHFEQLQDHFDEAVLLPLRPNGRTHVAAAKLFARCRWRGISPRNCNDCLIAQIAIENNVVLLHNDRDFELIQKVATNLQLL